MFHRSGVVNFDRLQASLTSNLARHTPETDERVKDRSTAPAGAIGESIESGQHIRRTPLCCGSVGRLDEDSRFRELVEVPVSIGGLDARFLRQPKRCVHLVPIKFVLSTGSCSAP